jgi:hypothetical protein
MREFPLAIYYSEGDIFIWWAGAEMKKYGVVITVFFHYLVCRRLRFVDKIRIENIKLRERSVD